MSRARRRHLLELLLALVAVVVAAVRDGKTICNTHGVAHRRLRNDQSLNLVQKRATQVNATSITAQVTQQVDDDNAHIFDSLFASAPRLASPRVDLLQLIRVRDFDWHASARGLFAVGLVIAFVALAVNMGRKDKMTKLEEELSQLEARRHELDKRASELACELAVERKAAEEAQVAGQDEASEPVQKKQLPTTEQLLHEAKLHAKAQEIVMRKTLQQVAEKLDPMIAKVDRARDIVVDGATKASDHVVESIKKDCNDVMHEVMETLEINETQRRYVTELLFPTPPSEEQSSENCSAISESPVNLAILVAGLMAPAHLQGIASWNKLILLLTAPILCLLVFAMAHDYKKPCAGGGLWIWIIGMASILGFVVIIRGMFLYVASSAVAFLAYEEKGSPLDNFTAGSAGPVAGFRKLLNGRSRGFFRALHAKDALCNGFTYRLLNSLSILEFIWGGVGVVLSMRNIVEDERFCEATIVLTTSHVFAFFYVSFFLFNCVALMLKLATILVGTDFVALECLQGAKQIDDAYCPEALPVVSILVRAFFLRDSQDTEAVELIAVQRQLQELKEKKQAMEDQQANIDKEIEQGESLVRQLAQRQQERQAISYDEQIFVEEHARQLEEAVNRAAPLLDYADIAIAYGQSAVEDAKHADWSEVAERTRAQASDFAGDASAMIQQHASEAVRLGSEYASHASASAQELLDSEQVQHAVQCAFAAAQSAKEAASVAAQSEFARDTSARIQQHASEAVRLGSEYASRASASTQELLDSEQVQHAVQSASAAAQSAKEAMS